MRLPLWLTGTRSGVVTLATCRNCGKTKVTSDPCGFDHAAALIEFGAVVRAASQTSASVDAVPHPSRSGTSAQKPAVPTDLAASAPDRAADVVGTTEPPS